VDRKTSQARQQGLMFCILYCVVFVFVCVLCVVCALLGLNRLCVFVMLGGKK
jgi:hypothetical protein